MVVRSQTRQANIELIRRSITQQRTLLLAVGRSVGLRQTVIHSQTASVCPSQLLLLLTHYFNYPFTRLQLA